jgi:hypothetical protein
MTSQKPNAGSRVSELAEVSNSGAFTLTQTDQAVIRVNQKDRGQPQPP